MHRIPLFLALSQLATLSSARVHTRQAKDTNVLKWVDPLIGTQKGGNVFAGATLPYGMAKGKKLRMAVLLPRCSW